jgi:5-methylcytosine-specific restriction enzyme subunit McrC
MIRRTILEWQSIDYGEGVGDLRTIPLRAADRIAAVAAASPLSKRAGGVLEHGRRGLRAHGVVGVIAAEGCALEILPKIDFPGHPAETAIGSIRRRLVHMLAVALDIRIDPGQVTALDYQRETLLELLVRLFTEKLVGAVRQGMPRRYVADADDLAALRGRLDVTRQFTVLAANPSRLACRYDALSPDIALNRIMKAAVTRLSRIARSADNQRRLRELAFAYADIAEVAIPALRWDDVVLDRTNERWRQLFNLARLLLGDRFQTTSAGGSSGFSLLFEMNTLFEEYVARVAARAVAGSDLKIVSQGGRLYCLKTDNGGLFQTKPDILVKRGGRVIQIIDTKWKRIARRIDDKKQGISQADVYQMMAYGRLYDCSRLTLLYPHHHGMGGPEGVQASHKVTGSDHVLETATIDVAVPGSMGARLFGLLGVLPCNVPSAALV